MLRRQVLDGAGDADARRVDEHVEPAESLPMLGDEPRALLGVADVGRDRDRAELLRRASTFSARREASVSSNPSSRSMRAIARPMPEEPPVTSAARSICVVYQEGNARAEGEHCASRVPLWVLSSPQEGGGFGRRLRTIVRCDCSLPD